jgi:hypothetical protein
MLMAVPQIMFNSKPRLIPSIERRVEIGLSLLTEVFISKTWSVLSSIRFKRRLWFVDLPSIVRGPRFFWEWKASDRARPEAASRQIELI